MNTFTFGKYKGRSIMSVLSENPAYVEWCVNHIEWFTLGCQEQKRLNDITEAIMNIPILIRCFSAVGLKNGFLNGLNSQDGEETNSPVWFS